MRRVGRGQRGAGGEKWGRGRMKGGGRGREEEVQGQGGYEGDSKGGRQWGGRKENQVGGPRTAFRRV